MPFGELQPQAVLVHDPQLHRERAAADALIVVADVAHVAGPGAALSLRIEILREKSDMEVALLGPGERLHGRMAARAALEQDSATLLRRIRHGPGLEEGMGSAPDLAHADGREDASGCLQLVHHHAGKVEHEFAHAVDRSPAVDGSSNAR
jgi:hypothetical protein